MTVVEKGKSDTAQLKMSPEKWEFVFPFIESGSQKVGVFIPNNFFPHFFIIKFLINFFPVEKWDFLFSNSGFGFQKLNFVPKSGNLNCQQFCVELFSAQAVMADFL